MSDYITETGSKLHYVTVGNIKSTPLVLIHGQGMCGKDYEKVKGLLLEDPTFFNVEPGEFENTFVIKILMYGKMKRTEILCV